MKNEKYFIKNLNLKHHPEGGYYSESYVSKEIIVKDNESRPSATSIYFMLTKNEVSNFHQLKSDEIWYYQYGSSLVVYSIEEDGTLKEHLLGPNLEEGESLQIVIKAGCIFGSAVKEGGEFSVVGCMVTPGFVFEDFKLFDRDELLKMYPNHKQTIKMLTREK